MIELVVYGFRLNYLLLTIVVERQSLPALPSSSHAPQQQQQPQLRRSNGALVASIGIPSTNPCIIDCHAPDHAAASNPSPACVILPLFSSQFFLFLLLNPPS